MESLGANQMTSTGQDPVRGELKHLDLDPDPATLAADPSQFAFLARMLVGPAGGPGGESFDVTVCSPEWLAEACRRTGGVYNARHHLVVNFVDFDRRALETWLTARVQESQAETWAGVAEKLSHLGYWEFENYTP